MEYDGTDIGTIADETTYREAAQLARDRVHGENGEFTISDTPKMQVTLTRAATMMDTSSMCNAILRTKGDAIAEGCGLYVDGNFVGSMPTRTALEEVELYFERVLKLKKILIRAKAELLLLNFLIK